MNRRHFLSLPLCCRLPLSGQGSGPSIRVVVSSRAGDRLSEKQPLRFTGGEAAGDTIVVDGRRTYQTIDGFGATFNEAGLMVLRSLDPERQEAVLESVFNPRTGAGFNLMKSPLAACDFSAAGPWFTYDDVAGDVELAHFSIQRDLGPDGMITFIRRARKHGRFSLQATTDYPPDWMLDGKTRLKREYFPVFARYLVKYVQEYARQGVVIDYLSPFNEPKYIYSKTTYEDVRDLIREHIGPAFRQAGLNTRLQVSDANSRDVALKEFPIVLRDPEARRYISTMPAHGYEWHKQGSKSLTKLHDLFPDIPIWMTEVCYVKQTPIGRRRAPIFEFEDGDWWGRMIVADLQNWTSGWIYWNMILDHRGGPFLVSEEHGDPAVNHQHPLVIINTEKKEVTYTGAYYYLAHFSKFVQPGAVRIAAEGSIKDLAFVAFQDPAGKRILEVVNSRPSEAVFGIREGSRAAHASLPAMSIGTFIW